MFKSSYHSAWSDSAVIQLLRLRENEDCAADFMRLLYIVLEISSNFLCLKCELPVVSVETIFCYKSTKCEANFVP